MINGHIIENFCRQALPLLGASVVEESPGILLVTVPTSALDLFEGRNSLRLAFDPQLAGEGIEVVVPGSYVLEKIIEAVRTRGKLTELRLRPSEKAHSHSGIEVVNADVRLISSETSYKPLLMVNYRISLISDEDQDRLYSVAIDPETLKPVNLDPDLLANHDGPNNSADFEDDPIDLKNALATAVTSAADYARKCADSVQEKIDARLAAEISRLDEYYTDLLLDYTTGTNKDVKGLQKHRDKAAEAYAEASESFGYAKELLLNYTSSDEIWRDANRRRREIESKIQLVIMKSLVKPGLYNETQKLEREKRLTSRASETAERLIHLPRNERIIELEKVKQEYLESLQKKWESKGSKKYGEAAVSELEELKDNLESEKRQRIAELEDKFQLKVVVSPVNASIIRYPRTVNRFAAVTGTKSIEFKSSFDLVTGKVEPPVCMSCGEPLAKSYICTCGRLVCPVCQRTCAACGKCLCTECTTSTCCICGSAVCSDCVHTCVSCGKSTCKIHSTSCRTCGKTVCKGDKTGCSRTCAVCMNDFCVEHIEKCPVCASDVCKDDIRECSNCGTRGCRIDVPDCPCCERPACPTHRKECRLCGQSVCETCLDTSGHCRACSYLFPVESANGAIRQILTDLGCSLSKINGSWFAGETENSFVLVKSGIRLNVYVVDKSPCRLRMHRKLGISESLAEKVRLLKL